MIEGYVHAARAKLVPVGRLLGELIPAEARG
jgi:hypothetical protein